MMKTLFCAAASILAVVATSAAAADPKDQAVPDNGSVAAQSGDGQKAERRYCVVDTPTGTRIPKKTCKTRAAWMTEGFDPLNP